ncbi:hypothetical protein KQH82_02880 [bacterium]|nr:hypothetical protein [bacterium]
MPSKSVMSDIRELRVLVRTFGQPAAKQKLALVHRLRRRKILRPSELRAYHDLLCFMVAYPDNAALLSLVERELRSMVNRVRLYRALTRDRQAGKLDDSGMAGTTTTHPYSYELTVQLLENHAARMEMDGEAGEKAADEVLPDFLPSLVAWQENDALDYDEERTVAEWLTTVRRSKDGGMLKTLVDLLARADLPHLVRRHFFERLDIETVWHLEDSRASRTLQRVRCGKPFYQTEPMIGRSKDLRGDLRRSAARLQAQSAKRGAECVRAVNEVLAVRNRELFPLTLASPGEVYRCDVGRGLTMFLFGMRPEDRLPIESNFGALLVRNNLPIGYGVAAVLFDRVEIAINIFPAFRAGESAFTIEQYFRLFYRHFGSRIFLVRNTQMGYGEDEALLSGAFWFYNKLGFRAVDPAVRKLAEREAEKQRADRKYRTPLATMRRLSVSDVVLLTDGSRIEDWKETSIINLGYTVTRYFADNYDGDRRTGIADTVPKVQKLLGIRDLRRWTDDERTALSRMAPLVAMIPDLRSWTSEERKQLGQIVRAKGGKHERRFVLLCNRHPRFKDAVRRLAARQTSR